MEFELFLFEEKKEYVLNFDATQPYIKIINVNATNNKESIDYFKFNLRYNIKYSDGITTTGSVNIINEHLNGKINFDNFNLKNVV